MPVDELPPPAVAPHERDLAEVLPADSYKPDAEVWVHLRDMGWLPGAITVTGLWGVQVRFELPAGRGTAWDIVMPDRVALRVQQGGQR
ncbi:MAG TPA: hypothetical protein VGW74_11515 [Propionibacteriaceae bacterium]|nr:hypothetical protein [Propionibacteriaceae bacterium]